MRLLWLGVLIVLCACLSLGGMAQAETTVCGAGSAAGQCANPTAVAADWTAGRIYVADSDNNRIDVFSTAGSFLLAFGWGVADGVTSAPQDCGPQATPPTASCFKGLPGGGAGQLAAPQHVAVDNDPASPAFQAVYVTDANLGVQRFTAEGGFVQRFGEALLAGGRNAISVGPGGDVFVGSSLVEPTPSLRRFAPDGSLLGTSVLSGTGFIGEIAADSVGDVYVNRIGPEDLVQKFTPSEPNATLLYSFETGSNTKALAIDGDDNVFAAQQEQHLERRFRTVSVRDSSGTLLRRIGYGEMELNLNGLAVDEAGTAVFGAESTGNRIIRLKQAQPGPLACCTEEVIGNTHATLEGGVNPEGKSSTYHFEYISGADYEANGNSYSGPSPAVSTPESGSVGSDFNLYGAEASIGCADPEDPPQPSCLLPEAEYRYRLIAKNADGESSVEDTFVTKPPFEIKATWSTAVGVSAATLNVSADPFGIPAAAYFEYVDAAAYQADLAEGGGHDGFAHAVRIPDLKAGQSPLLLGDGEGEASASVAVTTLAPGATYYYRAVVEDPFEAEPGPVRALNTYPAFIASAPCANDAFRLGTALRLPDCRAYEMVSPVDKNGGDIKVLPSPSEDSPARFEQAAEDGSRLTYSSVTAFGQPAGAPYTSQYLAARGGAGWSTVAISPPRESKSFVTDIRGKFDVQFKLFSSDLSSGWLTQETDPPLDSCAPSGFINFYRRDSLSGAYEAISTAAPTNQTASGYLPELQGVSADGSHVVFRGNGKLTTNAAGNKNYQLYEWVKGEGGECGTVRLVSVLPDGKAWIGQSSAGSGVGAIATTRESTVARAVSSDGTRIVWSASASGFGAAPLYMRLNADREQSVVSAGKCSEPEKACTIEITASAAQYWTAAIDASKVFYTAGGNLFEAEIAGATSVSSLVAGGVPGVVAASEDGARLYFVSTEVLGGEGEAGEPNLYLREEGETRLIGTLFGGSAQQEGDLKADRVFGLGVAQAYPLANGVRITADGGRLAFLSAGNLTGYDNVDVADGRLAVEVYLYDAEGDELVCVSCNPSGSRPAGRLFGPNPAVARRVAAKMAPVANQLYTAQNLSADGNRLFFESFESLLPRDDNGRADVYQWTRAGGQGECEARGTELFVPAAKGCISLISSGQSTEDSEFVDASADGSDVFFKTGESLLPQDPGQFDVYDARVGGGFPVQVPPPLCDPDVEASCQPDVPAPVLPRPSSDVPGPGNPPGSSKCPKGKHRVKTKKGKTRCVPRPKQKKQKQKKKSHKGGRAGR